MSRQLRLDFPGAIWHITSRGNEKRDIYRDDVDRELFLHLLADVVTTRRWILHSYVLMSNHYHLLAELPEAGLSLGMKQLNEQYAHRFNDRHGRVGHLFQGRFKGILVERESHLLELCRYLPLNPVRCGLVAKAGDYRWSSYRATAGLEPSPVWLETPWTLRQFHPLDSARARQMFREFVGEVRSEEYRPWEAVIGQTYLGGDSFRATIQKMIDQRPRCSEFPSAQRNVVRPSFDHILECVCEEFAETVPELRKKNHRAARKVLAYLAVTEGSLCQSDVGECMMTTPGAISRMVGWVRERMNTGIGARVDAVRLRLRFA